jgi:hypothetical protein
VEGAVVADGSDESAFAAGLLIPTAKAAPRPITKLRPPPRAIGNPRMGQFIGHAEGSRSQIWFESP